MHQGGAVACALALGMAVLLPCTAPASAAMYKWVDDKGVVHYTDKVPPDQVDRSTVELNRQGVPVKRTDAAPTLEQRRARALEEERRRQASRQQEEVSRRDRALLASYTSEGEIDLARNRALGTIDAALQSATAYSDRLKQRKVELEAKRTQYKQSIPPVLEREYENITDELARQGELIVQKRKEMASVAARYDADKLRYRELSAAGKAALVGDLSEPPSYPGPASGARR